MDTRIADVAPDFFVHLFDVGPQKYGDALLCRFGDKTVLIDGGHPGNDRAAQGHPSLQSQIAEVLNQDESQLRVDLLIVTHAHSDHIGCLPSLVTNGLRPTFALVADPKLGWGRGFTQPGDSLPATQAPAKRLSAALREEIHTPDEPAAHLQDFVDAAAALEPAYNGMLDELTADTAVTVVRYIGPGSDGLAELLKNFDDIGLTILGPDEDHLTACAVGIRGRSTEFGDMAERQDLQSDQDVIQTYMRITAAAAASDASFLNSQGAFINCQSMITSFKFRGKTLLFTGDMQLSAPGVSSTKVIDGVERLKASIKDTAPYSFVKLAHHGSKNGFSAEILEDTGCHVFGICGGSTTDQAHPDPLTLQLLQSQPRTHWARTDRNGQSRFIFTGAAAPRITVATPPTDDPKQNGTDLQPAQPAIAAVAPVSAKTETPPEPAPGLSNLQVNRVAGTVRLTAEFPADVGKVSITIEIAGGSAGDSAKDKPPFDRAPASAIELAGGRQLPKLLFVTNRAALQRNVGETEATRVLEAIRRSGQTLIDDVAANWIDPLPAVNQVRRELTLQQYAGVVLVGGYDVVPSQRVNCLPSRLRSIIGSSSQDADNFIVWSDDVYGDFDDDGIPELPVSRIPDGHFAPLLLKAIQAAEVKEPATRVGFRNSARPFADRVFRQITGKGTMLQSHPVVTHTVEEGALRADLLYLMLHGSDSDGTRYWGENNPGNREAMGLPNVTSPAGSLVFTGCCWGALIVDQIASEVVAAHQPANRSPDQSIALKFLLNGVNSFIGCTGEHYSPEDQVNLYFGGAMHKAFWSAIAKGAAPALALWQAKREYALAMPHGQTDPEPEAIEFKILRQYTCLGLGW